MNKTKLFPVVIAVMMLIMAVFPVMNAVIEAEESPENFSVSGELVSGFGAAEIRPAVVSSSSQTGVATIESDPSRLSAPGYVTITIKLRNTNSSVGGNSVGSNSFGGAYVVALPEDGVLGFLNEAPLLQPPISSTPPSSTEPPESSAPSVSPVPVTPPPTSIETVTPAFSIIPIATPTPVPQAGRFTHISITNPYGVAFTTSDVNPGAIGVFKASMMVYESMIGQTLSFTITWYDTATNNTYSQNLGLQIQRSDTAYLRLDRTVSTTRAAAGEEVAITYSVVNTGSRRLSNITIVDDKIAGSRAIAEPFSLASGERREIVYTYVMKGSSVTSKPVATFTPEGGSSVLSVTVSKMTIGLINAQITKSVNIGSQTSAGVTFTLFMTNNGSQNLSGLTVKDDLGNILASDFSLAIGESKIIEHFIPNPDSLRNVVFYITGTYDSDKEFSDNTTSYPVRPYINPALLGLKFRAEVSKQLDSDNDIGLEFTVENTGRLQYTNIVLTEESLGYTLHEIDLLAASADPVKFNIELTLDEPRELVFILTALDPSGNTHTFDAHVNAQSINVDPAIPNVTPSGDENTEPGLADLNIDRQISEKGSQLLDAWKVLRIIFVVAVIVIALLGVLEYVLYRRAKNEQKEAE